MTTPWQNRIPVLPTLITLGSLLSGFGAIVLATLPREDVSKLLRVEYAAWLILAAMVFDALDGRVARLTRQTSEFGGELDSLCDIVSFGVAPAALAMSVIVPYYPFWAERLVWVACAVFVVCAAMRLARFNVSTAPHDEEVHRSFVGLPSPPAAGMIASFVILHLRLSTDLNFQWVGVFVLPVLLLVVAPLMISRVRYVHLIHELTRGQRSFPFFVGLIFAIFLVVIVGEYVLPVLFSTYLLSGIVGVAIDRILDRIDIAQNRGSFFR